MSSNSTPDTAPAKAPDSKPAEKKKSHHAAGGTSDAALTTSVIALYGLVGTGLAFVNQYDGLVVLDRSETMAQSLIAACKPYPQAMRVLRLLAKGNVWTVLLMAHLPPIVAIAANHGILAREAPTKFGLPTPPPRRSAQEQGEQMGAPMSPAEAAHYAQAEQDQMAAYVREQVAAGVANNGSNGNGHIPMPLGDTEAGAVRAAFTAEQIDGIRAESIRRALEMQQQAQANPDAMPNPAHNPMGWSAGA